MPAVPVAVEVEVATDAGFADVVLTSTVDAVPADAHTVHLDATGLDPDTWYWYRFVASGWQSPVGRTRTMPAPGAMPAAFRFAQASCQSWTDGYYTAHEHLAQEELDLVVFLGDYIYEGGGRGIRAHNSPEVKDLAAYRNRYALYKGDPNLQASHAAFPWVVTWDDHELDNNYSGLWTEDGADPAQFAVRKAAAYKAWWEHQPVRVAAPSGAALGIHRRVDVGALARFHVLDTRQHRDAPACGGGPAFDCPERTAPGRTMLGAAQEGWLADGLASSPARWDLVAQSVVFSHMMILESVYNMDQWDGYPIARQTLVDQLAAAGSCPVVLSGDIHAAGAAHLTRDIEDPASPRVGTELVTTSISSTSSDALQSVIESILEGNPSIDYVNAQDRGYLRCTLSADALVADFRVVSTVEAEVATVRTDFSVTVACEDELAPTTPSTTSTTATSPSTTAAPTPGGPAAPIVATPAYTG